MKRNPEATTLTEAGAYVERRESELAAALVEEREAGAAFDKTESEADQKKALASRVRRESKERLLADAKAVLARAQEEAERAEKLRAETECMAERKQLLTWQAALAPAFERIIEADAMVASAVDAIADATADAMNLHARYSAHAKALGWIADVGAPDIATAKRSVRDAVTSRRMVDAREDTSTWITGLTHAETNWKTRHLSAGELAAHERATANGEDHGR